MAASSRPTTKRANLSFTWRAAEGDYVRALRENLGKTQQDLADEIGVRNKTIVSGIETGRVHVPPERLEAYAKAVEVPLEDFAKRILRYQHPWAYAAIFGSDDQLRAELARSQPRVTPDAEFRPNVTPRQPD